MCLWGRGSPPAHHQCPSSSSSSSRCHRVLQPPVSPPLACRTTSSTLGSSSGKWAAFEGLAVRRWWWWWSLPTFIRFLFVPTQQKRQEGGEEKNLSSAPSNASALSPSPSLLSLSPLSFSKAIYGQVLIPLPASQSVHSKGGKEETMHRKDNVDYLLITRIVIIHILFYSLNLIRSISSSYMVDNVCIFWCMAVKVSVWYVRVIYVIAAVTTQFPLWMNKVIYLSIYLYIYCIYLSI